MARILIVSDDQRVRAEITWSDEIEGWSALCECGADIVAGSHEQFSLADTVEAAEIHVDLHAEGINRWPR